MEYKQKTFFKDYKNKDTINIDIYADESKKIAYNNENITYIMVMAIPCDKKENLFNKLNNSRCLNEIQNNYANCKNNCKYHINNNVEIHYSHLGKHQITRKIANKWIDILLENDKNNEKSIYFNILGIKNNSLEFNNFGENHIHANIYNRFFRTALVRLLRMFDEYKNVEINHIFHDKTDEMQNHFFFENRTVYKILYDEDIKGKNKYKFNTDKIEFIDSNHITGNIQDSQFIQFVDLILGVTENVIHANASNETKIELTNKINPLITRILENPGNKNSSYNYFNKQTLSFFPKMSRDDIMLKYGKIDETIIYDLLHNKDNFENGKQALFNKESNQLNIFDLM